MLELLYNLNQYMKHPIRTLLALPRVARLYIYHSLFASMYYVWPVWFQFASERLTAPQVGLYFSMVYITQLIAEVPTGAFADRFGRRLSAMTGAAMLPLCPLILYFGHSFPAYLTAGIISGVAGAFISGSLDALLYDDDAVSPKLFRSVAIYDVTMFQSGLIISAGLGGILFSIHRSLPFWGEFLACIASFVTIFKMREVRKRSSRQEIPEASRHYVSYIRDGFEYLLATKQLCYFAAGYVLLAVAISASIEFVNEAAMIRYGIAPEWRGLLIAGTKVFDLIVLNLFIYSRLKTDTQKIVFTFTTSVLLFGMYIIPSLVVFVPAYIMFNWVSATRTAFLNPIVQDVIPSSHRATAMSSLSALVGVASLVLYPAAGWLIQTYDDALAAYGLFLAMVVMAAGLLRLSHNGTSNTRFVRQSEQ